MWSKCNSNEFHIYRSILIPHNSILQNVASFLHVAHTEPFTDRLIQLGAWHHWSTINNACEESFSQNMDKPIPQWWSTYKSTLASRLTMLTSHTSALLASYTLLLLLVPTSGVLQPDAARQGLLETSNVDDRGALILEAVKKGILGSLGLDKEPKPAIKASQRELRKMFKLYREKISEMRRNSSQSVRETWQSNTSTVLFPGIHKTLQINFNLTQS